MQHPKAQHLGVMSILLGVFFHFWLIEGTFNSRILLGIAFLFITGPVGGHMMGRAAYLSGVKLWDKTVRDDLAEVVKKKREHLKEKRKRLLLPRQVMGLGGGSFSHRSNYPFDPEGQGGLR